MRTEYIISGGQGLTQVEEWHQWWDFWPGGRFMVEDVWGILAEGRTGMNVGRESSTGLWVDTTF